MIRRAALGCAALLAGCSAEPEPAANAVTIAVPATETPAAPVSPAAPLAPGELPAPELDGAVPATGSWEQAGAVARFGTKARPATFAIRCDPAARSIAFIRPGARGAAIRIVAASGAATYPAINEGGTLVAQTTADDRFVADTLMRADGQLAVQIDTAPPLSIPTDRRVRDVIQGCSGPR
ncbi:hypothetical protein [Sphingomonas japonica]|uniref:Lipoprotein n=1 Tax=Sphingomonas japonica TaxID=511662 RepID=A0ABX0U636_9SPHN|nr:hypothetical protein [Sphingomonas japonica]NIJ24243.1 hypothetical protein [Sphingomonas japonica]